MDDLYGGIQLNSEQSTWICRGLLDLAAVDGVHDTEEALIREFYGSSGGDVESLEQLAQDGFDLAAAQGVLTGQVRDGFLLSCYMLIYADGQQSELEKERIAAYAEGLGVTASELDTLHTQARLYLLQMLAVGLRNRDAVSAAGAALGLSGEQIASIAHRED